MGMPFFSLLILCLHIEKFVIILGDNVCKNEPHCKVGRTVGMKSVDCYGVEMRTFPKCIPKSAEVLDLTFNRIRKVTRSDLSDFSYLKFLYLKDNLLVSFQNDTFEDMDDLQTLDLSQNNINIIPPSVLKLPSLKKLYLSQNFELDMAESLKYVDMVISPISMIDISCTTQDIVAEFPNFGVMPYLTFLNISENHYKVLTPKYFAGMCSLEMLSNVRVSSDYEDSCDCWVINRWLAERNVEFKQFSCPVDENACQNSKLKEEDKAVYNKCLEIKQSIENESRILKISIGLGASILIILLVIVLVYCYYKRNQRKRNTQIQKNVRDGSLLLKTQSKVPSEM